MAKKEDPTTQRITLYFHQDVVEKLKIKAIKKKISPSDYVEGLVKKDLAYCENV